MKPDPDPHQHFREMLSEDASHLPAMAARAARESRVRRDRLRRRWASASLLTLLVVGGWHLFDGIHRVLPGHDLVSDVIPASAVAGRESFVRVRTMDEALAEPLPPPPGATPDQKDLLDAARGLPLLLVLDASGKPSRIVVVER